MKKEKTNYNSGIIAIVAIVAIVGIVVLLMNQSGRTVRAPALSIEMEEERNVVGEAGTYLGCWDTDGGKDYYVKGIIEGSTLSTGDRPIDYCVTYGIGGKTLVEYWCESGGRRSESYVCPYGCFDGRCTYENERCVAGTYCFNDYSYAYVNSLCRWSNFTTCPNGTVCRAGDCIREVTPMCTDTDPSNKLYIKGKVYGVARDGSKYTKWDFCTGSGNQVNQYWCYANPSGPGMVAGLMVYNCPHGCENGVCKIPCTETDGGKNLYKKGTTTGYLYSETTKESIYTKKTDYCKGSYLYEYYCKPGSAKIDGTWVGGTIMGEWYERCPYGCVNNACRPGSSEEPRGSGREPVMV